MKTILIILVSILIAQCGSEKNNDSSSSQAAVKVGTNIALKTHDELTGTWKSPCSDDSILIDTNTFADKTNNRVITIYTDADCTEPYSIVGIKRTYAISAHNIDFTIVKLTYKFVDQDGVDECNKAACYGFTDWTLNVGKEVTGIAVDNTAAPSPKAGDKLYQIFKVVGNLMYYGDTTITDGNSPAMRPDAYKDFVLIKQ